MHRPCSGRPGGHSNINRSYRVPRSVYAAPQARYPGAASLPDEVANHLGSHGFFSTYRCRKGRRGMLSLVR